MGLLWCVSANPFFGIPGTALLLAVAFYFHCKLIFFAGSWVFSGLFLIFRVVIEVGMVSADDAAALCYVSFR